MAKKNKKNKPNDFLQGLSDRYVAAIVRTKMITKDRGDESLYNRKDKSWKKDLDKPQEND